MPPRHVQATRPGLTARVFAFIGLAGCVTSTPGQTAFTLEEALRVPYALNLIASPEAGPSRFAWVEVEEGRHNLWVGAAGEPARALTQYTEDDGQELRELVWMAGGQALAYTRGPENGADAKPANAAHTQPPPVVQVWIAGVSGGTPQLVGEGHGATPLPGGRGLLFVRAGQVWEADGSGPGGKLRTAMPVRQLVWDRGMASQLTVSPDGSQLAFISRRDHNHSFLALFDLRGGTLSFPAASTGNDSAPVWSPDGKRLAWLRAPGTEAAEFAVNRVSGNPWSLEVLDKRTGAVHAAFTPEAGKPGSVLPHMSTGAPKVMWADGLPGQRAGLAPGRDRQALIFASEADGWVHLYGLAADAPAGAKPTLLTPFDGEVETPVLSPDRKTLFYSSRGAKGTCGGPDKCPRSVALPEGVDRRTIWKLDLTGAGTRSMAIPLPVTPPSQIAVQPTVAAGGRVAALVSDATTPTYPALLSTEPASLSGMDRVDPATPLGVTQNRGAAPVGTRFVTPQQVQFPSADGRFLLQGQLFEPGAAPAPRAGVASVSRSRPAVLFFHGGPRRQMLLGYPAMEYYAHAYALNQYLASRGFVVLSVNYRGGVGYGIDFREAAHTGADGASEYSDVLGAIAYLRSRPDVDGHRIGSWGGSYGGYLTALALARNSDLLAAGVDFHGVHEWGLEDNRADWLRGTPEQQKAIAATAHASSPMADIEKWRSPVLLIHGDNDANVAYAQTPLLADALRARNVPVGELIFPDEIHEFLLYRDWLASYKATAAFLEQKLSPGR